MPVRTTLNSNKIFTRFTKFFIEKNLQHCLLWTVNMQKATGNYNYYML